MLQFSTFFKTLPRFYFANFILKDGKYLIPPKPKKGSLKDQIIAALRERPEYNNLKTQEINKVYQSLSEEEKNQIVDIQERFKQYQEALKQWHAQYDFPKRPMNFVIGKLNYLSQNLPEAQKQANETQAQYLTRLNKLVKEKEDFFKEHDNLLKQKLEYVNKARQEQINKYKEEYEYPTNMSIFNFYTMKLGGRDFKTTAEKFKALSTEEKAVLQQEYDQQFLQERNKKLQKLADKFNVSVEELQKEVKKLKKEQKIETQ